MKPRDLWELMVEILGPCLNKSDTRDTDVIVDETLMTCSTLEDGQEALVRDAVSGTLHFEKVCEGMLRGFCDYCRRTNLDRCSMYLIAYFVVFRYEKVGGHNLREMFYRSTTTNILVDYLEYMTDPEGVTEHSCGYWNAHYDSSFVENFVCHTLQDVATQVRQDIVEWLQAKVPGGVVPVRESTEEDVCKRLLSTAKPASTVKAPPSSLWEVKPPTLPPAEVREMMFTIPEERPPRIDCSKPPTAAVLPRKTPTVPIGFSFMQRRPLSSFRKKIQERGEAGAAAASSELRPPEVKVVTDKPVEVRPTAGTIRREALLYIKREEERKRALKEVEVSLHDAREYDDWRERERKKEEQEQAEEVVRRKEKIKQIAESATEKRKAIEEAKKAMTQKCRSEKLSLEEAYAAQKEFYKTYQQGIVEERKKENLEKRERALKRMNRARFSAAARVRDERERLKEEANEEQERIREERLAIIQEMQALRERNRQRKEEQAQMNFESREVPSHSYVSHTMTDRELREELSRLKVENAHLEEERRAQLRAARQKEREKLEALLLMCAKRRQNVRRARVEEIAIKKAQRAALEEAQNDEAQKKAQATCDMLKQKRNNKRAEHLAFAREDRMRQNKLVLLAKDAHTVEENRWKQQELGVVNRITLNQNKRLYSMQA
ncbi:uncharacterized protein TEOVI_000828200 [Trypanosoma equiperdum]|uniref:Uncharacterized protein n=2 Tax=Trypanozoon TaxID=39700 RepID=Q4FKP4_TRYB2|nr:hypothetical protein, conserved [Trypanosoma brucei brucei TREU927]EAN77852.1 hypothetical protein, conserved [Trypanosoma brucei brucei TREU927]CAJ16755.1 hypothetical protein, conserved [Trypanosoma brucei brucei TREU927]SCU66486.1 hypothetical protein, conserved [Trypanosoma equiperdum]